MKIEANIFSTNRHQVDTSTIEAAATVSGSSKFHRAAIDGYIDMLCDASKRDTNLVANDDNGLTPTLLAAQNGHLDALRILVGRGGNPEKSALDGSNALHLAAARNHLNCVSFLVNFGVNMWSLDNELHTAKDLAAIGQKKEVLDYLDQMMAKQSALNTKNVQKLKDKAKVGAEKRLKQMRKAQLRAIKQVEKDERFLVKLSNNRRLLKTAHSISDIKLVGRSDAQIQYSPSEKLTSTPGRTFSSSCPSEKSSPSVGKLSSSPGLTNFMNHKLKFDLLSNNRRARQLNFGTLSNTTTTTTNTNWDELSSSAYSSSSVSSTSGYLSSWSTSALNKKSAHCRPKYSDLVAVNQQQPSSSESSSKLHATRISSKNSIIKSNENQLNERQSLNSKQSNSSIGTRLRVFGGVSRKVQLKRFLLLNTASSTNNLNVANSESRPVAAVYGQINQEKRLKSAEKFKESHQQVANQTSTESETSHNKIKQFCNVQPAIKLKLNSDDPFHSARLPSCLNLPDTSNSIKWPPAPIMTRAVSEPDFGAALRLTADEEEEEDDDENNNNKIDHHHDRNLKNHNVTDDKEAKQNSYNSNGNDSSILNNSSQQASRSYVNELSNPIISEKPTMSHETSTKGETKTRDESQHYLLTQCLSQLKLRHNAISKEGCENQLLRPSKLATSSGIGTRKHAFFGNSDELLQHQLNAGEFPLRPSIIKQNLNANHNHHHHHYQQQQQQQQQLQQQHQPTSANNIKRRSPTDNGTGANHAYQYVDSIGSAGSLTQRNSCSPKSSESSQSLLSYCSSSCSSSVEVNKLVNNMMGPITMAHTTASEVPLVSSSHPLQRQSAYVGHNKQSANQAQEISCTIDTFLFSNGLVDLKEVFVKEKIDLEALMLLSEDDLKSLNILLGPRRKLLKAIEDQRLAQAQKSQPVDSCRATANAMFIMVDTPL